MSKRNKTRPGPARTQRQRSIQADGIYNNAPFMHAATSHVGNVVHIQTPAGHIYEGVFRTFSAQFQIVLEMAHRIEIGPDQKTKIIVESFVERLIFKPNDIVTLAAKDVDPEYATRDTFKTDTAISRCNGNNWLEDRELEPWDGESGGINGDLLEHDSLELDSSADGWDVNEMFHKNETIYGVHSTFDQSLTGYTVPITKKDSEEFKVQELEAEKIANEIENNPVYKERIDIENGDEEAAFAAVSRPVNASPQPGGGGGVVAGGAVPTPGGAGVPTPLVANDKNSNIISGNSSNISSASSSTSSNSAGSSNNLASNSSSANNINNNNAASTMPSNTKYIVPAKRKPGQGGKLVRSTPPPLSNNGNNNNNGGPPVVNSQPPQQQQQQQQQQQPPSPQAPHKNSYGQMMPQQQHQQQHQQQQQQQQQQQPPPNNQQHGGGGGGMQHPSGPQQQYGMHANQSPYGHVQHQQQQQPQQPQQQLPPQQQHVVQATVMNANKMNGDGGRGDMSGPPGGGGGTGGGGNMNVNSNQKPLPQRAVRQYPNAPAPVSYSEPPPSLNPQQMPGQMQSMSTKPPMHMTHPHHAGVPPHMPPPSVVSPEQQQQQQQQQQQVVIQQHHVAMPPPSMMGVQQQQQQQPPQQQQQQPLLQQQQVPPPQPQRTVVVRNRDMEIDNLRKFGQDFKLAPPQQPQMPNVHQQPPPAQQQQQVGPPSQHQVVVVHQQQPPPQLQAQQQQQPPQDHSAQPSLDHSSPPLVNQAQVVKMVQHNEPPPQSNQQQHPSQQQVAPNQNQQNQASQTTSGMVPSQSPHLVVQQQQQQQQPPPSQQPPPQGVPGQQQQAISVGGSPPQHGVGVAPGIPNTPTLVSGAASAGVGVAPDLASANGSVGGADQKTGTAAKKVSTLNPAAKPFTPRNPSTPNPSRPHTPQTPGPAALPQGSFQPPVIQQQFMMQYVMNPSTFPAAQQHPHAGQPTRIRNGRQVPVAASQMQVAAATGQPLLAPSPLQMITPYGPTIHTQPFQTAPQFHQQYRTIYDAPQPAQLQYLAATPPSTTPSPGQPHQQYHPGPQPSPAGGGPPTYAPVHHQPPAAYTIPVCNVLGPPQVVPTIYQNITSAPQQNHHQQNLHVMHVSQHPSAQ